MFILFVSLISLSVSAPPQTCSSRFCSGGEYAANDTAKCCSTVMKEGEQAFMTACNAEAAKLSLGQDGCVTMMENVGCRAPAAGCDFIKSPASVKCTPKAYDTQVKAMCNAYTTAVCQAGVQAIEIPGETEPVSLVFSCGDVPPPPVLNLTKCNYSKCVGGAAAEANGTVACCGMIYDDAQKASLAKCESEAKALSFATCDELGMAIACERDTDICGFQTKPAVTKCAPKIHSAARDSICAAQAKVWCEAGVPEMVFEDRPLVEGIWTFGCSGNAAGSGMRFVPSILGVFVSIVLILM